MSSLEFEDNQDSYYVQYQESMGDAKPFFAGVFRVTQGSELKQFAVCNTKKSIKKTLKPNSYDNLEQDANRYQHISVNHNFKAGNSISDLPTFYLYFIA
ncbi:hypothetical protein [Actinobacillus vicugnae]|uniref:hypothetical protein n=1 Tax=Actinobacillus vicugnae TaxID=2573093 RepID=UPI00123F6C96|nr:hypothetical protein [Actinobacillus vicugnae]